MSGMLSTAAQPQAAAPSPSSGAQGAQGALDPILQKIEDGVEARVPQQLQQQYKACVVAGLQVMFNAKTHNAMLAQLKSSSDLEANVASGIADLMAVIYKQSNRQMSVPAGMLAAVTLMVKALDYAEKTMGAQITPQLASGCAQATVNAVLRKFGISQAAVQQAVQRGQQKQGQSAAPAAQGAQ